MHICDFKLLKLPEDFAKYFRNCCGYLVEEELISKNAINLSVAPRTIRCNKSHMKLKSLYCC